MGDWETINLLCQESWNTLGKNPHPWPLLSEWMLGGHLFTLKQLLPLKMTPQPASLIPKIYRSLFILNDLIENISNVRRKKKRTKRGVCYCVCAYVRDSVCVCA